MLASDSSRYWHNTLPLGGNGSSNGTVPSPCPPSDSSAPAPTLTQPAAGARTNDATPAFAGTGGTATGDQAQVSVKIYTGGSATGSPVQTLTATRDSGSGAYSVNAATLAPGTYAAQTEQQDDVGNSGQSSERTFTIDTSPPAPTLTQPAANASTSDATPNLAGIGGTATGDASQVSVKIYTGNSVFGDPVQTLNTTRDPSSGAFAVNAASLADGTYTAQAEQADDAGNSGQSSARTFTIDTSPPAPGPPNEPGPSEPHPTAPVEPAPIDTFSIVKTRASSSTGRAILVLEVPGPGSVRVDVTARARKRPGARATRRMKVARLSRRVRAAGRLTLTIKPSRAARAILRRERTLRVKVKVTYSPLEGSKTSRTRALRLKLKKQLR